MVEPTDEELMESYRAGDRTALETLYVRHSPNVTAYLKAMTRSDASAQDLLQTTFVSVMRSANRYERGTKVAPWLFTIARNAALDTLRRQAKGVEVQDEGLREEAVEPAMPDQGLKDEITRALEKLPPSQREAVVLHKVQGMDFEEVAQVLGVTSTAARIRAHRGYEKLRELLAHLEAV